MLLLGTFIVAKIRVYWLGSNYVKCYQTIIIKYFVTYFQHLIGSYGIYFFKYLLQGIYIIKIKQAFRHRDDKAHAVLLSQSYLANEFCFGLLQLQSA